MTQTEGGKAGGVSEYAQNFDNVALHRELGITLVEAGGGRGRIALEPNKLNIGGVAESVHGGIQSLMVDIVTLVAIFSEPTPEGLQPAGTADLNITYLRPAVGERIYADGEVVKRGRQLSLVEVSITNEKGVLCSRGRVLYAFRATT